MTLPASESPATRTAKKSAATSRRSKSLPASARRKRRSGARTAAGRHPPPTLLAAALRSLPEGVLIAPAHWSRTGLRIAFANERISSMTGYSEAELTARTHDFLHVDKVELARQRRWFRSARTGSTYSAEGYLTRRDGSTLFAAWLLSPLCNRRGKVTHIVASYRDVTEKRRLEEALGHAQRIDTVSRLAGGVAHDFNNLLSVINGYSEILADRFTDDEHTRRTISEIHSAGQKAATLTRQLLAFSRRQTLEPQVISLNDLIQANSDLLGRLLRPYHQLNLSLSPDTRNVRVDPTAIQQVLLNLTMNARDALSPGGHVTISTAGKTMKAGLTLRRIDIPPGRYTQLSVSDSGCGMDEDVQAHLFEPFFTTKPQGEGTGLGLALVYGVVQQNNGYISVHSAPGAGTTFDIYLPEVNEPASVRPAVLSTLPSTGGRESVLIVEGDSVLRKMIAGILTSDGYTVIDCATTNDAAATGARSQPIELAILDSRLPGAEGLVRELLARNSELRLLSTADHEPPQLLPWVDQNAQAHLPKPFTLSTLLKVIRALLDRELGSVAAVQPETEPFL
ncbi:MAG: PAS domain S-box protein [Opitutaceae bacterium]|nr:PAS domain S-box protein [Opitutaceae bacterium]